MTDRLAYLHSNAVDLAAEYANTCGADALACVHQDALQAIQIRDVPRSELRSAAFRILIDHEAMMGRGLMT